MRLSGERGMSFVPCAGIAACSGGEATPLASPCRRLAELIVVHRPRGEVDVVKSLDRSRCLEKGRARVCRRHRVLRRCRLGLCELEEMEETAPPCARGGA